MARCTLIYREAMTLLEMLKANESIDKQPGWNPEELAWSRKLLTETQYVDSASVKPCPKTGECIRKRTGMGEQRIRLFADPKLITTETLQSLKAQLTRIQDVKNPIIKGLPVEVVVAPNPRGGYEVTVAVTSLLPEKK